MVLRFDLWADNLAEDGVAPCDFGLSFFLVVQLRGACRPCSTATGGRMADERVRDNVDTRCKAEGQRPPHLGFGVRPRAGDLYVKHGLRAGQ